MSQENDTHSDASKSFFREIQIEFLIHELKGPVSIIETGLRTLLEKKEKFGPLSPKQEKTLNRALRNTKKTRDMLNHLMEIGRSEAGCFLCCRFEPARALNDVLMEELDIATTGIASSKTDADRRVHLESHDVFVSIDQQATGTDMLQDETKFRQIFGNLVKNALKHRRKRIDIQVHLETDSLVVDVADDGPGVKPEHQELIFKRYTQVEPSMSPDRKGHGLGLAGALILARCMGGDIRIKSEPEKGATFRLILPLTMEKPQLPDQCAFP